MKLPAEIVLASRNRKKLAELQAILRDLPTTVRSVGEFPGVPEVVEDGDTFAANAAKKALAVAAAVGRWAVADDSGIEVDALGGRPGVHSARFAGPACDDDANNRKLVELLRGVPADKRTCRYRCCIVLAEPGRVLLTVDDVWEGRVVLDPRGRHGFGYDPYVWIDAYGKTVAELDPERKNRISHRGKALAKLKAALAAGG
jgi:XTP/dITP diphosphohydrolase